MVVVPPLEQQVQQVLEHLEQRRVQAHLCHAQTCIDCHGHICLFLQNDHIAYRFFWDSSWCCDQLQHCKFCTCLGSELIQEYVHFVQRERLVVEPWAGSFSQHQHALFEAEYSSISQTPLFARVT